MVGINDEGDNMLVVNDLNKNRMQDMKRGFKITLSAEALDEVLRSYLDMPDGEPVRFIVDQERLIISMVYTSQDESAPLVREGGEVCERSDKYVS